MRKMTLKERYDGVIAWFSENMPSPETELHYDTPFHLLLAVILSAQCTDKRVNIVTPPLFEAYSDAAALAAAFARGRFAGSSAAGPWCWACGGPTASPAT